MITDGAGKEYRRNRRQIHLTHEPFSTISEYLSEESESVTDQFDVNLPNVSTESRADLEPTTTDTDVYDNDALHGLGLFQVGIRTMTCTKKTCIQRLIYS